MKRKWSVQFRNVQGAAVLTYDDQDRLEAVDISELYDQQTHRDWLWAWFPRTMDKLLEQSGNAKLTINAVLEDLSFPKFWDTYDYKIGKKQRAEKIWEAMNDTERSKCLLAIPAYKYWLAQQNGIAKLYPETFLSQKRWQNEFKTK